MGVCFWCGGLGRARLDNESPWEDCRYCPKESWQTIPQHGDPVITGLYAMASVYGKPTRIADYWLVDISLTAKSIRGKKVPGMKLVKRRQPGKNNREKELMATLISTTVRVEEGKAGVWREIGNTGTEQQHGESVDSVDPDEDLKAWGG